MGIMLSKPPETTIVHSWQPLCFACEEDPASTYCVECKAYYCSNCFDGHHMKGKAKEHKKAKVSGKDWKGKDSLIPRMCPTHKDQLIGAACIDEKSK